MAIHGSYDPDEDDKDLGAGKKKFKEWDCPSCNANNPSGETINDGDELTCNYCGTTYQAKLTDEGKLKLKEW